MEDFRIAKASPDDVNRIMELVNKAFEISIGDSGKGFKKKTAQRFKDTKVVYMCFSLLQLAVESIDSTEREKKNCCYKTHKMTTLFTQNDDFFFKPDHFE